MDKPKYLWEELRDKMRADIISGKLKSGDRLLSLSAMSKKTGISIPVVKLAYKDLENRGMIKPYTGKGYFVVKNAVKQEQINTNISIMQICRLDKIDNNTAQGIANRLNAIFSDMLTDNADCNFLDLCAMKSAFLVFEKLSEVMNDDTTVSEFLSQNMKGDVEDE